PMLAPSSKSAPAGSGKTRSAGTTVNSCAVPPAGRPSPASVTQTRSPTPKPATPAPISSTTPAPSWLGTVGSPQRPAERAAARLPACRVHSGHEHPNPHLAVSRLGNRLLHQLQHRRIAEARVGDRTHAHP